MDRSPIYDSAFKTMAEKMPELLVPLVNEAFGTAYPEDAPVTRMGEEHAGKRKKIVDAAFCIGGRTFHIECQSSWDPHMAMRMDEYDREIAHEEADARGEDRWLVLPASCVVFLRDAKTTPDFISIEIEGFGGAVSEHRSRAIWAKQMSADEMFEKHLLILLPFWLMRYEGRFDAIVQDSALEEDLLAECRKIQGRLAEAVEEDAFRAARKRLAGTAGNSTIFWKRMTELIIEVSDHLLRDYGPLQGEVREAMGGKILKFQDELHAEEMRELEERFAEREQRVREESLKQGIKQGIEQANRRYARELSAYGVEQSIIDKVFGLGQKDEDSEKPSAQG